MATEVIRPSDRRAEDRLTSQIRQLWKPITQQPAELQQSEKYIREQMLRRGAQWDIHSTTIVPQDSPTSHTFVMRYQGDRPLVTRRLSGVVHPTDHFLALNHLLNPRFNEQAVHTHGRTHAWHDRRLELPDFPLPPYLAGTDPKAKKDARYGVEILLFEPSYGPLPDDAIENIFVQHPVDLSLLPEHVGFMEVRLKLVDFALVNKRIQEQLATVLQRTPRLDTNTHKVLEVARNSAQESAAKLVKKDNYFNVVLDTKTANQDIKKPA